MASKRPHSLGWLLRWREPSPADPRRRVQRSWVCSDTEARAEVFREEAEAAERAGVRWCPPDRRSRPGRADVDGEVAALLAEHGLRGAALYYLRALRTVHEEREEMVDEIRGTLRRFLRWVEEDRGRRVASGVLPVLLPGRWWDWMRADDREGVAPVRRGDRTYLRSHRGPLARTSACKEWTTVVAFWRWAAQVDEFGGQIPFCPTERLRKPYSDPGKKTASRRPVVAATWGQAAASVAAVPEWIRPLVILCYCTGLRVGQARSLTWEEVLLDGAEAERHGGPVLWIGQGKTPAGGDGRFLPVHPALVAWLRERRASEPAIEALPGDLRRMDTAAYKARVAGIAEGRIAWEVGDQNLSSQLGKAWRAAGVPGQVWENRTAHALRTNVMAETIEPGSRTWQAAERLIGHALPGELDTCQSNRVLMATMRRMVESIPPWEQAAAIALPGVVLVFPSASVREDLAALG